MKHRNFYSKVLFSIAGLVLVAGVGCDKKESAPKPDPEAMAKADTLFKTRCASCHGPEGRGNGPAAANLNPKPRDFHDQTWQASATDEGIEKTITYGGAAVGKSPVMVANPDLQAQPEVVAALRYHIRQLGKE